MFETNSFDNWKTRAWSFFYGETEFLAGNDSVRLMDVNPHLPYIYIPDNDWSEWAYMVTQKIPDIKCDYTNKICRFENNPCDELLTDL